MRCNSIVRIICLLATGAMIPEGGADAAPRPTNDSRPRANGKANSGTVRAVTGDSAQFNAVVAGTPPSAFITITPVNPPDGGDCSGLPLKCQSGPNAGNACANNAACPPMPAYPPGTSIVGNTLRADAGPFRMWLEVRLSNWDPNGDNIPPLGGFQATIDATGYMDSDAPGDQPDLVPPVIACPLGNVTLCRNAFGESWAKCSNDVCKAGYVDRAGTGRPDSWCGPNGGFCAAGDVDTSTLSYRWVLVSDSIAGHPDQNLTCVGGTENGFPCDFDSQCGLGSTCTGPAFSGIYYGGSLILDVPVGAQGKYTVNLNTDETMMWDSASPPNDIPTLSETGFVVNIAPPPPTIIWDPSETSPLRGSRSLSIGVAPPPATTATNTSEPSAIKVTLIKLQNVVPPNLPQYPPPDFSEFECASPAPPCTGTCDAAGETNGCARWVGKPGTYLEAQDEILGDRYKAARLQCTPYYTDWVAATKDGATIAILGAEITPSSNYGVQIYVSSLCEGHEDDCTPDLVEIPTRRLGDVAADYQPEVPPDGSLSQPNAIDVAVMVAKFKDQPGSPSKAQLQLQPNLAELNGDVNALDILAVVDAVKQRAYTFGGPCPCPSQAACELVKCAGATVCTSSGEMGLGAEALCVKTCTGPGPLADEPCINNTHCVGSGTCGVPMCLGGPMEGAVCTVNQDCGKCFGGPNMNGSCDSNNDCPGSTCNLGLCNHGYCRDRCGRCTMPP